MKTTAKDWLKRIDQSVKLRDKERDKKGWLRFIDEYEGDYRLSSPIGSQAGSTLAAPPINMVYGYVHTMIPKLYFRDPYVSVNAKGQAYINRSHILEAVMNYLVMEIGLKRETAKAIIDTILVGHGWIKVGYAGSFGKTEKPEDKPVNAPPNNEADVKDEVSQFVKEEEIFAIHVPWDEMAFDIMSKDPPYDCRWLAHKLVKPLEDVKNSPLYKFKNPKSNISLKEARTGKEDPLKDVEEPLFALWEIWDMTNRKILAVAEGQEEFGREDVNTYDMSASPFSMLKFNTVPGKPYPLSDIFLIEPQILERIKIRATQINHIKRWNRQLSIEQGSMETGEVQKLEQGVDGSVTQRKAGTKPPEPIQYAQMQAEIFQLDDLIARDMEAVIGQTEFEEGGQAKTKTRTLGEIREQLKGTNSRAARRQDMLEDFLEEVITKLMQLVKQFQDTQKYVRITGMSEQELVAQMGPDVKRDSTGIYFDKSDIQGNYDVDVKAGSTVPLTKENKLSTIEAIAKEGPAFGIQPGGKVSRALGREYLRELNIKEAEKAWDEEELEAKLAAQQKAQQPAPPQPMPGNMSATMPPLPPQPPQVQ